MKEKKSQPIKTLEGLALQKQIEKYPNFPYPIKTKYTDNTTNGLTKCVIDYLNFNNCQAERISSTGSVKDNRKTVTDCIGRQRIIGSLQYIKSTSTNGTADISATIQGKSIKIEIKCKATGDNYQSAAQKEYQSKIQQAGGIYLIVRDFESFYNWFQLNFCKQKVATLETFI
jgi:hypothetical protein